MDATVIGLGTMGTKLAQLLLAAGWRVTVWNRSPDKAAALVQAGARPAVGVEEAVRASPVLVICVKDYAAANAILASKDVPAALAGRTVIHLTSGGPREALAMDATLRGLGAHYLDGAIQAAPEQMGQADTPILVSGAREALRAGEDVLKVFGGGVSWLGERASLASAMDFATLSYVYGATTGFFHGVSIAETEGLGVDRFAAIVAAIAPSFGEFLRHEGNMIHAGNFAISQSPMRISVDATERIAQHASQSGLDETIPALFARLFREAADAGYADEEAAAVIKVLRSKSRPRPDSR